MKTNRPLNNRYFTVTYRRGRRCSVLTRALLTAVMAASSTCAVLVTPSRADEFSVVPTGDVLYRHLSVVTRAGWTSLGTDTTKPVPQIPSTTATLTRYEMALETAKALVAVKARQESNPQWASSVSKPAVKALHHLTQALRPELKGLGVDVAAALKLCTQIMEARPGAVPARTSTKAQSTTQSTSAGLPRTLTRATTFSRAAGETLPAATRNEQDGNRPVELRLSQRLWVSTALSALQRESLDPLSDTPGSLPRTGEGETRTNVSLSLNQRFSLRAMYDQHNLTPAMLSLQPYATSGSRRLSSLGGGVDVALRPGMTFSGSVENLAGDAAGEPSWTRYSGGIGLSAWESRLSLQANLSRLVPDDVRELPTTVGGVGLGFDVNERLSLSLLYQQLFSVSAPTKADRLVAGGLSINF